MTERPILFSGPMVRAILEGRKTQTRRIVKPQPPPSFKVARRARTPEGDEGVMFTKHGGDLVGQLGQTAWCRHGMAGDRLWVRETWADMGWPPTGPQYAYRADPDSSDNDAQRWKPSIHMPRSASRITLEVLNVRVERLHGISEEDAKAEGVTLKGTSRYDGEARDAFETLWCSINGAESWENNPWCWCISFKVISPKA